MEMEFSGGTADKSWRREGDDKRRITELKKVWQRICSKADELGCSQEQAVAVLDQERGSMGVPTWIKKLPSNKRSKGSTAAAGSEAATGSQEAVSTGPGSS